MAPQYPITKRNRWGLNHRYEYSSPNLIYISNESGDLDGNVDVGLYTRMHTYLIGTVMKDKIWPPDLIDILNEGSCTRAVAHDCDYPSEEVLDQLCECMKKYGFEHYEGLRCDHAFAIEKKTLLKILDK